MFDKYGFYYLKELWFKKYILDIGASLNLDLPQNEYVVFHKRRFFKKNTNELQKNMALVTESCNLSFSFDEQAFKYWLTYYQRNWKNAFIKGWDFDELELYQSLYKSFWLDLKLRKYLEIVWEYENIESILNNTMYFNLSQAISFLLALATIYGDWNLVEDENDVYLSNILIKFPFDSSLSEYQNIILNIEDVLLKNKLYNKLTLTKKQDFIWNIYDRDLLKIMWEAILHPKLKDFYNVDEKVLPLFEKKIENLKWQLNTDLRINLDDFKLVEIEKVQASF